MHVFHPAQAYQGIPPENLFLIADESNQAIAQGYMRQTYQPYLFPERPVNLYFEMQTQGPGRDMLLGALLARAYQLRAQTMYLKSRVYTQVTPGDEATLRFYTDAGFDTEDAEDIVQLGMPDAKPAAPMGYELGLVPLGSPVEQAAFLTRMNTYRISAITPEALVRYLQMQDFTALYVSRGKEIVGEGFFSGQGASASLLGLYVMPNYRRLGIAKNLIAAGMQALGQKGVGRVDAAVLRRNAPQCHLAQSCRATFIRTRNLYPGVNID